MAKGAFLSRRPLAGTEGGGWSTVFAFFDLRAGRGSAASGGDVSMEAAVALRLRDGWRERVVAAAADDDDGAVTGGDESPVAAGGFVSDDLAVERVTLDVMSN